MAGWAGIVCAALLAAACNGQATRPVVTDAPNPSVAYLAQGQDIHGTAVHAGVQRLRLRAVRGFDRFLSKMTWHLVGHEAVGRASTSSTAATRIAPPGRSTGARVVTLSNPVKVCSSSGPDRVWTKASFRFPHGLPKALRGQRAAEPVGVLLADLRRQAQLR